MSHYFPYGIKAPESIPDVADKVLDDFFEVASELEMPACLAYGICLGFVRDGGYIPADNDLDVVIITELGVLPPELVEALEKRGFIRKITYLPPSNNTHFVKDDILLDVFNRTPEGFYRNLSYVNYKSKRYPIPHPVKDYLEAIYSNWKVKSNEQGKGGI